MVDVGRIRALKDKLAVDLADAPEADRAAPRRTSLDDPIYISSPSAGGGGELVSRRGARGCVRA
jgi:hypothetical protein